MGSFAIVLVRNPSPGENQCHLGKVVILSDPERSEGGVEGSGFLEA